MPLRRQESIIPKTTNQTKTKIEPPRTPGKEIQIDFTGNQHNKNLPSSSYIFFAVDNISRWPVQKNYAKLPTINP